MPLDDRQRFVLSMGAVLATENGEPLDALFGGPRPRHAAAALRALQEDWGITTTEELVAQVDSLLGEGSGYGRAYDLGRAATLVGFGGAGYLLEESAAWARLVRIAEEAQRACSSFHAFGEGYAHGYAARGGGDIDVPGIVGRLLTDPASPWVTLPFALPLAGVPVPRADARTWRVGKRGADAETIGAVLARASDGDRVEISAGTYEETLRVSTPAWDAGEDHGPRAPSVTLVAKGRVLITSKQGPVVEVSDGGLVLIGITLVNGRARKSKDGAASAVEVLDGFLRLEDCTARAPFGVAVAVHEVAQLVRTKISEADVGVVSSGLLALSECSVGDTKGSAVVVEEGHALITASRMENAGHTAVHVKGNAHVRITDSRLDRSGVVGVGARARAHVAVARCTVDRSGQHGLAGIENASITADGTHVTKSGGAQVSMTDRAALLMSGCTITGGADIGVSLTSRGTCQLLGTTIEKNQRAALVVAAHASPMLSDCTILGGKKGGALFAHAEGRGVVLRSRIVATNAYAAVELDERSHLTFDQCELRGSTLTSVWVHGRSRLHLTVCDLLDAGRVGLKVDEGSAALLRGSRLMRSKVANLAAVGADVTLVDTRVSESGGAGIELAGGASLVVRGGSIEGNAETGVLVTEKSRFDIEGTELLRNEGHLYVSGSEGRIAGSVLRGAKRSGVFAEKGARVTVDACRIAGNGSAGIEGSGKKTAITVTRAHVQENESDLFAYERARILFADGAVGGGREYAASAEDSAEIVIRSTHMIPGALGETLGQGVLLESRTDVCPPLRVPWTGSELGPTPHEAQGDEPDYAPCALVEHGTSRSLILDAGDVAPALREALDMRGVEPNGYGLALLVRSALEARDAKVLARLRFDPEAGMLSVICEDETPHALAAVAALLREASAHPGDVCAHIPEGARS